MDLLQSCAIETAFAWPTWSSGHAMTGVLMCRRGHWQPHQAVGVDCCQHKSAISLPLPWHLPPVHFADSCETQRTAGMLSCHMC
jgi:hypothetical protein